MASQKGDAKAICAYCGKEKLVEREHFVPKCLWSKPYPSHLETVPACQRCNRAKRFYDDYVRDLLALDIRADGHPEAERLRKGEIARAMRTRRSHITPELLTTGKPKPYRKYSGLLPVDAIGVSFDGPRLERGVFWIARGLFFEKEGICLPRGTPHVLESVGSKDVFSQQQFFVDIGGFGTHTIGDVFTAWYLRHEDPTETIWLLVFYGNIVLKLTTGKVWTRQLTHAPSVEPDDDLEE